MRIMNTDFLIIILTPAGEEAGNKTHRKLYVTHDSCIMRQIITENRVISLFRSLFTLFCFLIRLYINTGHGRYQPGMLGDFPQKT